MEEATKSSHPWRMLFADDIAICRTRTEHLERKLRNGEEQCKKRRLKISRKKSG